MATVLEASRSPNTACGRAVQADQINPCRCVGRWVRLRHMPHAAATFLWASRELGSRCVR